MSTRELAILTGGSRGIGFHVLDSLLGQMDVLNLSRTPAEMGSVGHQHSLSNLCVDLANVPSVMRTLEEWLTNHRDYCVRTLISNAAALELGWLVDSAVVLDSFTRAFALNAQAPLAISSTILRMHRFCEDEARIVYVTSSLAQPVPNLTFAGLGLYSATKAALSRLAQIQARELELTLPHIRVVLVHPGIVDTDIQRELRVSQHLDPAFSDKTAGLPPYRAGDWSGRSPQSAMRTVPARFAADFLIWIANEDRSSLKPYYDFYAETRFHERPARRDSLELPSSFLPQTGTQTNDGAAK